MRSIWKYGAMGGCYDALHSGSSCSVLLIMVRWVVEFSTWVLDYSMNHIIGSRNLTIFIIQSLTKAIIFELFHYINGYFGVS